MIETPKIKKNYVEKNLIFKIKCNQLKKISIAYDQHKTIIWIMASQEYVTTIFWKCSVARQR